MSGTSNTPISVLNLSRSLKSSLHDAGYKTLADVGQVSASDLSTELGTPLAQAEELLKQIEMYQPESSRLINGGSATPNAAAGPSQSTIQSSTAADLLSTFSLLRFSTQASSLDALIAAYYPSPDRVSAIGNATSRKGKEKDTGAIVPGMTVEISGPPGGGKTAVAIGVALSARVAKIGDSEQDTAHQVGGEVLVIDTEGGITAERLYAAAEVVTRTLPISTREVLRGIHLVRISTQIQMIAFLHTLDGWLDQHPNVNLIVIDTLSYHFRQPGLDISARRRIMDLVKQNFGKATTVHQCAVVVTNQLATKLLTAENKPANFDTGDRAVLMPQLGDSWTTGKTLRIVLFRGAPGDELRYAHASMSGSNKDVPWACFDINSDGLPCDVPEMLYKRVEPNLADEVS